MITPLENLVDALTKLPTIGKKSAWRLALFLVEQDSAYVSYLARCIAELKEKTKICRECFNYCEDAVCSICASGSRNRSLLCVVEKPLDVFTIERSGKYLGLYHVLGGVLSPINGITTDTLRIAQLQSRVARDKPGELIIGLGGSADAETTALFLSRIFADIPMRITRLARGLPAGFELEYVDQMTLSQALHERIMMHYTIDKEEKEQ
jgi:recombination protein RecR